MISLFSYVGWLAFVVALTQTGCGSAPAGMPEIKAPTPAEAYRLALSACIVCSQTDLPGCDDLAPVCDGLAGMCDGAGGAPAE